MNYIAEARTIVLNEIGSLKIDIDLGCAINTPTSIKIKNIIMNNPKTQFIMCNLFKTITIAKLDNFTWPTINGLGTGNCKRYLEFELMTEETYNRTLGEIFHRTCRSLCDAGYVYSEKEKELNGWLKFIKDITRIEVVNENVKYKIVAFVNLNDGKPFDTTDGNYTMEKYRQNAILDIFEEQFKKELIRKV